MVIGALGEFAWAALLMLFLSLAGRGGSANSSWPTLGPDVLKGFWSDTAARFPSMEFIEAVRVATLVAVDGRGLPRRLVLLSIASESTFRGEGLWQLFLTNLRNITFTDPGGRQDHLARHLVASVMTLPGAAVESCRQISEPYGARCVAMTSPLFTDENYRYKSAPFFGLSFAKVLTILNALTLDVDVLFLDGDQVFFRNPLPYILARDVDVLVTGDCGQRDDVTPADRFPKINSNIGLLYMRSTPAVTRATTDWLYFLMGRATRGRAVLDQGTFTPAMEWVSTSVGAQHMSVAMLLPDHFPHRCMSPCGCSTVGLPRGAPGRKLYQSYNGTCDPRVMYEWYHFHVPCNGDVNMKAAALRKLLRLYESYVGPVNSLSSPLKVL